MNESDKTFREKLLDMEKPNASYKKQYEMEVLAMVEKKLTGWTKLSHIVGLIMGLGFTILFGTMAVIVPKEFPIWGRFLFALGAVFGLAIIIVEVWILKKGTINLKKDEMAMAGLGWGFVVIVSAAVLVFSGQLADRIVAVHMLVSLLFYLVMAAVFMIRAFIQRSELNTREKLLEVEYRLADHAEKIESKCSE